MLARPVIAAAAGAALILASPGPWAVEALAQQAVSIAEAAAFSASAVPTGISPVGAAAFSASAVPTGISPVGAAAFSASAVPTGISPAATTLSNDLNLPPISPIGRIPAPVALKTHAVGYAPAPASILHPARLPSLYSPAKEALNGGPSAMHALTASRDFVKAQGKKSWTAFWNGGKARAEEAAAIPVSEPKITHHASSAPASPWPSLGKAAALGTIGQSPIPSPRFALQGVALGGLAPLLHSSRLAPALPYVEGLGILVGAWLVSKVLGKTIWARLKSKSMGNVKFWVNAALWTAGGVGAVKATGLSWEVLGLGTLAVSMAVRELIGHTIQGIILLFNRPFGIHEKIKLGNASGAVIDMDFRYLIMREDPKSLTLKPAETVKIGSEEYTVARADAERATLRNSHETVEFMAGEKSVHNNVEYVYAPAAPGGPALLIDQKAYTPIPYSKVADEPLTIYEEYSGSKNPAGKRQPAATAGSAIAPARGWGALAADLALLAAALACLPASAWLLAPAAKTLPYLWAAAALAGAWFDNKLVRRLIEKLAKDRGWDANAAVFRRWAATGLTWAIGIPTALSLGGISWSWFLGPLGVIGMVVGLAASVIISNLIQAATLMATRRPFAIGDKVELGDYSGAVIDMTFQHVILKPDSARPIHYRLPYSFVNAAKLKVLGDYPKSR